MRKLLLLGLAMGLGTITMAQNAAKQIENSARKKAQAISVQDAAPMANPVQYQSPNAPKGTTDVMPIDLFSSVNVYTLLVQEQTCVTYNEDIDAIMFTARGQTGVIGTGNTICTAVSTDKGGTFSAAVSADPPSQGNNRYPSGAIYNPAGNTDPANAFIVMHAPITGGSGWLGNNFATNNWSNTALFNEFLNSSGSGDMLIRGGLDVIANGNAFTSACDYTTTGSYVKTWVFKGEFDATAGGFKWVGTEIPNPFRLYQGAYDFSTTTNVAFSPDGSIGYAVFTGMDARANEDNLYSYGPIVYKTIDNGQTWEQMAMLDLKNNPAFIGQGLLPNGRYDRLWPLGITAGTSNEIYKPRFDEQDIVVDYNGDLHIFASVRGMFSDHTDSLTYIWRLDRNSIYEIYNTNQGDDWHVRYIDNQETYIVAAEESGYGAGADAVGWDHRLQASRAADGKTLFAIWTDTDSEFFGDTINLYPDVRGWAHKVDERLFTDVKDFTWQGATYGENYFIFVSPTCINHGNGTWEIPVTKSDIRKTNDPGQQVDHDYLKGITFEISDFIYGVGVEQVANVKEIEAYPNPVSETLTIEVTLNKTADMTVEMTNLLGQSVYSYTTKANAGLNTMTVNVADMQAGIYFYSVVVDGKKTTDKVIVR